MNKNLVRSLSFAILVWTAISVVLHAQNQEKTSSAEDNPAVQPAATFPDLTIPDNADIAQLQAVVARAKTATPGSEQQYKAQQTAIRVASAELVKRLPKDHPAYPQTELDMIMSSATLLTFFDDDQQVDVVEKVQQFLKSRESLSMQDVQIGVLAAGMVELQPDKEPAKEIYQLLDELLKDDQREEMQRLRINLQASVRRLDMLGQKFELDASTVDGKLMKTEDLAGKFVLVDIFATWCEPCLAEQSRILSHYQKYRDRGLEVVGISIDDNVETLNQFLKKNPLPWPVIHDGAPDPLDRLSLKYGISALPTVLLLNKEGTVVSLEARNSELNRLMQMLFETPTPAQPAEDLSPENQTPEATQGNSPATDAQK